MTNILAGCCLFAIVSTMFMLLGASGNFDDEEDF